VNRFKQKYFTTDKATTYLGLAIALVTAFGSQGIWDQATAGLIGAILVALQGYLTNKK